MIKRVLAGSAAALLLLSGTALADYTSDQDVTLSTTVAPSLVQTDSSTGDATFALQEEAHDTVTDTSGESVDHYYIWVYVNGQPVLAVDPIASYSVK